MSEGITIEAACLSAKRAEAEHDYFYCLKNYSAKHDMPLETPSRTSIERKLHASGFEFEGVSTKYVLEFVPHPDDFGGDTIALEEFDAAKRSEEHTSELQSLMRISYAVFCLQKKKNNNT